MKQRTSFVSNSSSSSFVIAKAQLTDWQLEAIRNHNLVAGYDAWSLFENDQVIKGEAGMDNFDMFGYFKALGIPDDVAYWDGCSDVMGRPGRVYQRAGEDE